jgi:hypothetical protein
MHVTVFNRRKTMPARTLVHTNGAISKDALMGVISARYAPQLFSVPDYDTPVQVQMVSAGDEEHCTNYARQANGETDWNMFARIWVAYAVVDPVLIEPPNPNRRIQAEQVATFLEDLPKDWIEPVYFKSLEMTHEYRRKRVERERDAARGGQSVVFPRPGSAPSSSETGSTSSTPPSSP